MVNLAQDNYFSAEADLEYVSASQIKAFLKCESAAVAQILHERVEEPSKPMLIGSYCDAAVEGTLDKFIEAHPEIISSRGASKGELKADFVRADEMIRRGVEDELFSEFLQGEKQTIITGRISGVPIKAKIDILHPDRIVDYKTTASFDRKYDTVYGEFLTFSQFWRYDIQGAIYQELVYQQTGRRLPFYMAAVTSEQVPDIAVINIPQPALDNALAEVKAVIQRLQSAKLGIETDLYRCEKCNHCKQTKKLTEPVDWLEIGE